MKTIEWTPGFVTSALCYGCMRIAGGWDPAEVTDSQRANASDCLSAAWDSGYTIFDHSDVYCDGYCEALYGQWLKAHPDAKSAKLISKVGVRFEGSHRWDVGKEWIIQSCEGSLRRLGVETLDLYLLHRQDYLMDPGEVAEAFETLAAQGKVRYFGVSNFLPTKVLALQKHLGAKLLTNQFGFSLQQRDPLSDGTLDQCLELGLVAMAYSPLAGGGLGADPLNALRWLLRHPAKVVPVVGTTNPARIKALSHAPEIEISRETWYDLLRTAQGFDIP